MGKKRWLFLGALLISLMSVYGLFVIGGVLDVPKDLNITLDKLEYKSNEEVGGGFEFNIRTPIRESTSVILSVGNESKEMFLKDIFDESGISFDVVQSTLTGKNPVSSKRLFYTGSGKQVVHFKLPKDARGIKINFKANGENSNGSFPRRVSMDVAADGTLEWLFLGDFVDFSGNIISQANFNVNPASSAIMDNLGKYLCQLYDLPNHMKDLEVNAMYSLFDATITGGDINASILVPSGTGDSIRGFGGAEVCNLDEPTGTSYVKNTCRLKIPSPIKGSYLICVYNAKRSVTSKNFYRLGSNNVNSGKSYVCSAPDPTKGYGDCTKVQDTFYIGFRNANYTEVLDTEVNITKGQTERNFSKAIIDYLASCSSSECMIPVEVSTSAKGTVSLNVLQILYNKGGLAKEENSFYEAESEETHIIKVDGVDLNTGNVTLDIPLNVFGLKTPFTAKDLSLDVTVSFNPGLTTTKKIKVAGITAARELDPIEEAKLDIERFGISYKDAVDLMGMALLLDETSSKITSKEQEIKDLDSGNLTETQKNAKKDSLTQEIIKLREKLPKKIELKQEVSDLVSVRLEDVENVVKDGDQDVIYGQQSKIKVSVKAELYEVTDYQNKVSKKTLIRKKAEGKSGSGYIIEIIPKTMAKDFDDIKFSETPEIIEKDPIVKWDYTYLPFEVSYMVDGDASKNIEEAKSIVVPSKLEEEIPEEFRAVCGNNVCEFLKVGDRLVSLEDEYTCPEDCKKKNIPLIWIVLILLAAGVGLGYIYYKKKQPLFRSKIDEENLTKYVQKAISQKYTKERINKTLLTKNWNLRQIDYVYDKLLNNKKSK